MYIYLTIFLIFFLLGISNMLIYVIGIMGSGKTLYSTFYAWDYLICNKEYIVYSNYKILLKNCIYNPFMIFPFSELENCLIIIDDVDDLSNLNTYTTIIAKMSRKRNITVILTAQYYTMIPKKLRHMANYKVICKYDKENDILSVITIDGNMESKYYNVHDIVKVVGNVYDTREVVYLPSERDIIKEIVKVSKTKKDIIQNVMLCFKNKRLREKIYKELKVY